MRPKMYGVSGVMWYAGSGGAAAGGGGIDAGARAGPAPLAFDFPRPGDGGGALHNLWRHSAREPASSARRERATRAHTRYVAPFT